MSSDKLPKNKNVYGVVGTGNTKITFQYTIYKVLMNTH